MLPEAFAYALYLDLKENVGQWKVETGAYTLKTCQIATRQHGYGVPSVVIAWDFTDKDVDETFVLVLDNAIIQTEAEETATLVPLLNKLVARQRRELKERVDSKNSENMKKFAEAIVPGYGKIK
jgi:hypothetical protein